MSFGGAAEACPATVGVAAVPSFGSTVIAEAFSEVIVCRLMPPCGGDSAVDARVNRAGHEAPPPGGHNGNLQ